MKSIWKEKEEQEKLINEKDHIKEKFGLHDLASEILAQKNFKSDEEIERFLNPKRSDFRDPFQMPDMPKCIDRIIKAIDDKEKIIVYGDYDADGITSATILKRFFKDLGVDVSVYIPNRLSEGYGLNKEAVKKIASEGYGLIITVDCGITSVAEVELAKELKMDVIITDHHEPGEKLPQAIAVVDCKRSDSQYEFRELAGCGVAFKLTQALAKKLNINENEYLKYIDIACIGTISDIVPLVDENRTIAKLGLLLVNQTKNIGLRELLRLTGFKKIDAETISFGISPRINACGRMGHQEDALNLFLTNDIIKARELAKKLDDYNKERQAIEKRIFNEAEEEIALNHESDKPCIVLGKEKWHHGIIGIVSSKITEKYYKPSILVCFEGKDSRGSGRSIKGFDLHEALLKLNDLLENAGGHSMAIGLSLETSKFEEFKQKFEQYAEEHITSQMLQKEIEIDKKIDKNDISIDAIKELEILEPYGEGNKKINIIYKNLKIISIRALSEGKHIKLNLQDDNINLDAIGFNMGEYSKCYQIGDKVDVVGNIEINKFNNTEKVQISLKDMRKAVED